MSFHLTNSLVLDGYRLIRFLGRGGFGDVWLCQSEAMGDYRALKFIPTSNSDRLEKEYEALLHYRKAAARLRSPHLVPIEHVNRNDDGLYYVMPLADGGAAVDPTDVAWQPMSLTTMIHDRSKSATWFSSDEIIALIQPVMEALQTLSDAGLVHRDVKPENILFFNGQPCLGDISLLGADASVVTRRGTPGYATPSWYVGGHPDMYGAAATLYSLLSGNLPDKMGRTAFLWPPQGETSFTESERAEWKRLYGIIRRATEEKVSERFVDFAAMAAQTSGAHPPEPKFPRFLVSALALSGVIAATVYAGFHSRHAETTAPEVRTDDIASEAIPTAAQLTEDEHADYPALAGMIQGYIDDGQYADALASVETLLSTYPQARTQPAYSVARAIALDGLGRIEEAKEELRSEVNISPNITAANTRKEMWEEFGELGEAEKDLDRILEKFGPSTFLLYLRADIHAKQGDFPAVLADRKAALTIMPDNSEQARLTETTWAALETKFPAYTDYLKSLGNEGKSSSGIDANLCGHNRVLELFNQTISDISDPSAAYSYNAVRARDHYSSEMRKAFKAGDYSRCLALLSSITDSIPALAETPVLSLLRAFLLRSLERTAESEKELERTCHQDTNPRLLEPRLCLLDALGKNEQAVALLTRMIAEVETVDDELGEKSSVLFARRANTRAALGDYTGTLADQNAALAKIPVEPPVKEGINFSISRMARETQRQKIAITWQGIEARFPGYAAYLKSHPEK